MELVDFVAADGLRLDGLYVEPRGGVTIVHVHGKCGNFYQNDFIKTMLRRFAESGIGFLTFNHRGHDCVAEGYRGGSLEYVGGSVEVFEECILDIEAAMEFAQAGARSVVLQGHSNGAEKVLFYATTVAHQPAGCVFISPSDSYEMQRRYRFGETPERQIERLSGGPDALPEIALLPLEEYGIRTGDKMYSIPVTRHSLLRLLCGPAFRVLRLAEAAGLEIGRRHDVCASLVCLGDRDPYLTVSPEEMRDAIAARTLSRVDLAVVSEADHHFHGVENELVSAIVQWSSDLIP